MAAGGHLPNVDDSRAVIGYLLRVIHRPFLVTVFLLQQCKFGLENSLNFVLDASKHIP